MYTVARRAILLGCFAVFVALITVSATADPLFKGKEKIPADAIVLFDGKDLSQWTVGGAPNMAANWKVKDGYTTTWGNDIATKQNFTDCQLHVEFWLPYLPDMHGQARANSGVFFVGYSYEIQVLDSYGLKEQNNDCAAVYGYVPPLVNAARPPETWQTYDIIFHAAKFDASGKKIQNARATVLWNGVLAQDNTEFPTRTPDRKMAEEKSGPIRLQNHGGAVRYRNIWIRPL